MDPHLSKWNSRYLTKQEPPPPAEVLVGNLHLLPASGQALDLACGLGANALVLAEAGLETQAWDISEVAVGKLQEFAHTRSLSIRTEVRDVIMNPPLPKSFDVIVVSRFLARSLAQPLSDALLPGGRLFYETFTNTKVGSSGPSCPDYLLEENELLDLFSDLVVLVYRESLQGGTNLAQLVGRKA